jgi:hypothetical protein
VEIAQLHDLVLTERRLNWVVMDNLHGISPLWFHVAPNVNWLRMEVLSWTLISMALQIVIVVKYYYLAAVWFIVLMLP